MIEINNDNFEQEVLKSDMPVFVDFAASWCGPCKILAPVLEEFAKENAGKMKLCSVDVDTNAELAQKFSVSAVPQILVFKDGQELNKMVGLKSKVDLQAVLDEL